MHKCDECGKFKPDVEYVANPYDEELYGETNMEWLCNDCYWDIAAEV